MKNIMRPTSISAPSIWTALTLVMGLSACGPQAFVPGINHLSQTAGDMVLAPKVDILIGVDTQGAMKELYPSMAAEINTFANSLESNSAGNGWDFRLTAVSLGGGDLNPLTKIAVSKHDGNWAASGQWVSPYPGAVPSAQQISSSYFQPSTNVAGFFPGSINTNGNSGNKTGILNEVNFLTRADVRSNFVRNDAMLAVITLSDSRDTSGGQWTTNAFQQTIWTPPSPDNLSSFANSLISLKGSPSLVKYYALVSHYQHQGTCRGAYTFAGTRYEQMASSLGGTSIDICSNTLSAALDQVRANLEFARLAFHRIYLVLGNEPNPSTITITKNGALVPQGGANGWEYVGYVGTPLATIDLPVPMAKATGYMIKLNGSAGLTGNDVATIDYQNAGAVSSH